jgi:hypothetical protein
MDHPSGTSHSQRNRNQLSLTRFQSPRLAVLKIYRCHGLPISTLTKLYLLSFHDEYTYRVMEEVIFCSCAESIKSVILNFRECHLRREYVYSLALMDLILAMPNSPTDSPRVHRRSTISLYILDRCKYFIGYYPISGYARFLSYPL